MAENETPPTSFFARPGVHVEEIPIGPGVPLGIERVTNASLGIGGAYGGWGRSYDNASLPELVEARAKCTLESEQRLNLAELGFLYRHHLPDVTPAEHTALEIEVGGRLLQEAMRANDWAPDEIAAVLIGATMPVTPDFAGAIAARAGIPAGVLTVNTHKACDSSVAGVNLALNPELAIHRRLGRNLAHELLGKKVLVGGIEGLSRAVSESLDRQALQLFGNGAGIIGVIPGQTMRFLAGSVLEAYDSEGLLQLRMSYPHSRRPAEDGSLLEVSQVSANGYRIAGLMHEPETGPVAMAGPMGMVKLFVRNGVVAVQNVHRAYRERMAAMGTPDKELTVAIAHHANYKINQLKARQLQKEGFTVPMPWLLSDFGNVSAASNMIAFLRKLPDLTPGDHIMLDGFGAGTYYDVVAVELSGQS